MSGDGDETEFPGRKLASVVVKKVKRFFQIGSLEDVVWDESDVYDIYSKKRPGLMIVFNNEHFERHASRPGSSVDAENLQETFSDLSFEVRVYCNQTRKEMFKILEKVKQDNLSNVGCFACTILSHGDEVFVVDKRFPGRREKEDLVYASDQVILTREIVEMFRDEECPSLKGKPRLFIIQACRGNQLDDGVEVRVNENVTDARGARETFEVIPCPIYKDFLILYATPPGHFAFRRPDTGSWFINGLCNVFSSKLSKEKTLNQILTDVIRVVSQNYISWAKGNPKISGKKQCPCFTSMLVKDIHFK